MGPPGTTPRRVEQTAALAADFLHSLPSRPVRASATREELLAALGGPLPERGEAPDEVVADLAQAADPGLVASAGPRYFGFVIGGGLPSALAADWLTSAWDQNGFAYVMSPAGAVTEEIAAGWLLEIFGLPMESSVGFTTGVTMASSAGLEAGRHRVLARAGCLAAMRISVSNWSTTEADADLSVAAIRRCQDDVAARQGETAG